MTISRVIQYNIEQLLVR